MLGGESGAERGFRIQKCDCPATLMAEQRFANACGPRVCYNAERRKQDVPALAFYGATSESLKAKSLGLARHH